MAYEKKLPEPKKIYVIDFFAGCGGMSEGFKNTRQSHLAFELLAGIDIDQNALVTYEKNIGAPVILADIAEIGDDPSCLTKLVPRFDPSTHRPLVFIGCAPCQGFSAHRKKDIRDDPRNSLMLSFAKICKHYKPDYLVMENVPEIITGKYREYFLRASEVLEDAGYALSLDVLDLSLFGVPQRRRRAVVLGTKEGTIELPKPIFTKDRAITVREAIGHLSPLEAGQVDTHDALHRAPNHTPRIIERIKKTPVNGGDRRDLSTKEQLSCHVGVDNGSSPGFTDVYGRLRWDTPSVTITAKCSTPSCGRFLHPEQHRNISVREAAILQGFPQSYKFTGPLTNQYRQIGEAVPPIFSRFLASQVLNHIRRPSARLSEILRSPESRFKDRQTHYSGTAIACVDLFAGAGGLSLGLEAAGFQSAFALDIDVDAVSTYNQNIAPVASQNSVTDASIVDQLNECLNDRPYILAGGPPCQGFSQQRRGPDLDDRNNLVLKFLDVAFTLKSKPLAIILENVTYLDSPRGRKILEQYQSRTIAAGYRIFRHDLNSAEYGVPQLRRRIILVALQQHLANFYTGPRRLTAERWPTVGEALHKLDEPNGISDAVIIPNHEASAEGVLNKRRVAFVDMAKGRTSVPDYLQLPCHQKYDGHLDVYGRLDWFGQARTITGGFDSFTRGEYAHPFRHRSITAREAARIQGFPDWYVFLGNRAAIRRQIGNAVPPPVGYAIGRGIFRAIKLAGKE
jgi:DNA (cytosine-5)-methyltransferase 1